MVVIEITHPSVWDAAPLCGVLFLLYIPIHWFYKKHLHIDFDEVVAESIPNDGTSNFADAAMFLNMED